MKLKLRLLSSLLMCSLGLCACQSPSPPIVYVPPTPPELPEEINLQLEPNLTDRLLQILSPSQQTETKQSVPSKPASPVTTK